LGDGHHTSDETASKSTINLCVCVFIWTSYREQPNSWDWISKIDFIEKLKWVRLVFDWDIPLTSSTFLQPSSSNTVCLKCIW
jgi:hypothetical protein